LPSIGGAVKRIFKLSPCSPANPSPLALGCKWQADGLAHPRSKKSWKGF
jgi:hypothetical protein